MDHFIYRNGHLYAEERVENRCRRQGLASIERCFVFRMVWVIQVGVLTLLSVSASLDDQVQAALHL